MNGRRGVQERGLVMAELPPCRADEDTTGVTSVSKFTVCAVTVGAVEVTTCVEVGRVGSLLGIGRNWLSSSMSVYRRGAKRAPGREMGSTTTRSAQPTSRLTYSAGEALKP